MKALALLMAVPLALTACGTNTIGGNNDGGSSSCPSTQAGCPGYCPSTQAGCPGYCPSTQTGCPGYVAPDAGPSVPIAARFYAGTWHGSETIITDCLWIAGYNIPYGQKPAGVPSTCTNPNGPPNRQDNVPAELVVTYVDDSRIMVHGDVSCGSLTTGPILTQVNPEQTWGSFPLYAPNISDPAYTCTGATTTCPSVTVYLLPQASNVFEGNLYIGGISGNYGGTGYLSGVVSGMTVGCGETHTWYISFQSTYKTGGL
jgi:hypothetical protein